ncbi:MAG TPA: hypothetical protein VMN39_05570 [Longimicrobiaceae bacterium]|nr:hypothetical protein [Longimicrobiaceae bacterium]
MTERIHLVVGRAEKERYRRLAARAGKSLSEWLRDAAREKLASGESDVALDSVDRLRDFFAECDRRETGREPDWESHREIIERSIGQGAAAT